MDAQRTENHHRHGARPLAAVVLLALTAAVVMGLWNLVLPGMLSVEPLGYWQALGLLVLVRLLLGGFRGFAPSHLASCRTRSRRDAVR